jgi:hypothetical protein
MIDFKSRSGATQNSRLEEARDNPVYREVVVAKSLRILFAAQLN